MTETSIIIQKHFLSGISFKESLDIGLVCAAFDQKVNLIFVGEGVFNLLTHQNAQLVNDKNHVDLLKGLEFYEIDSILMEHTDHSLIGNDKTLLIENTQLLSRKQINQVINQSDVVVSL